MEFGEDSRKSKFLEICYQASINKFINYLSVTKATNAIQKIFTTETANYNIATN